MSPDAIRWGQQALVNLVRSSNAESDFFLVGVSTQPQLLQDWTRDEAALVNAVPIIPPKLRLKGTTPLYDGCYASVEKLTRRARRPKRILVLLSDGQDSNSKHTFLELERLLETSGVMIYAVGAFQEAQGGSFVLDGKGILDQLSSTTGGKSFYPTEKSEFETVVSFR